MLLTLPRLGQTPLSGNSSPISQEIRSPPDQPTLSPWALERLAWSPLYLSNAALLLARLTRLESEGRLANRPGSSLRGIFVLWYPQTAATFEEQLDILDRLREQEPAIAWKTHDRVTAKATRDCRSIRLRRAGATGSPKNERFLSLYAHLWRATEALITRLISIWVWIASASVIL